MENRTFYEFFAGGGMARLGLGADWKCLMANDIDPKKAATYRANFGGNELNEGDVYALKSADMPGNPDLAWASFPCQDLSLAGNRAGLAGEKSGAFWGFWQAINQLKSEHRQPSLLVLENVVGALSSNGGNDFKELTRAIASLGYAFGALVIDAVHFLPQSRPRLFIVCVRREIQIHSGLVSSKAELPWHTKAVQSAVDKLPNDLKNLWKWWKLPLPNLQSRHLACLMEADENIINWHTPKETARLIGMMSDTNLAKLKLAKKTKKRTVGTIYKRTRIDPEHGRIQRAEIRFDGIAGCLRTPGGGSSRQTIVIAEGPTLKTRLITVREAANLMGVPLSYKVPANYNDGYHVFGDGLAVPVVAYLREHLLNPLLIRTPIETKMPYGIAAE
jgi:DNA (cytosine-5)-methyltransferase 1